MNESKSSVGKYMFYGIVFFLSLVVSFVVSQFGTRAEGTQAMSEASLPVVMMQTEGGQAYNRLYGYTAKVDETRLNMELTLVPENLRLPVVIDTYNESVQEISYKIRAKSDYSLIENTVVDEYHTEGDQVSAVFNIKNLIRDEEEYYLHVIIKTDTHEAINYYTTIVKDIGFKVQDKLEYVLKFNACTLDPNRLSEIAGNLETSKKADNTNYGKVDITNSKYMVGWGNLKPVVESNIIPSVYMIDNEVAVVTLDYSIGVANANGGYDLFKVHEFYRIRQTSARFYLLNYDRQTTQIFDGKNDTVGKTQINLGVAPYAYVETMADKDNKYVYFVNSGSLWCLDSEKYMYSKVFAFESDDSDNVRERYDAHDIKILSVEEDGSAYFIVYGYMNRGAHEGQVGVSLYRYNYVDNQVMEELYIPTDAPAGILRNNVGEIAHVTGSDSLYIKIDEVLYQIDMSSKEAMAEIKGLVAGTYAISKNGKIIAYAVGGETGGADSIRVFNIEAGTDYYINAPKGQKVRTLGFVENDFIYGLAYENDVVTDDKGNKNHAMYRLVLMDQEFKEIRSYENKGYYIVNANVEGYRINMDRVVKNEAGEFTSASIDQLINRAENVDTNENEVDTISTKERLKQVVIKLIKDIDTAGGSSLRHTYTVEYPNESEFKLPDTVMGKDKYYVRGYGAYISSYDSIEEAVNVAQSQYGRVYDSDNDLVWKRFKAASASVKGLKSAGCSKENSLNTARTIVENYRAGKAVEWISLKNISVEYVLPWVDLGAPVIADTFNGYVIITGYTSKEITYLNTMNGQYTTVSYSDGIKLFSQAGNTFLTYYGK